MTESFLRHFYTFNLSKGKNFKMLKEYFYTEKHKDYTACKFCLGFVFCAEYVTDLNARHTKSHCDHAYKGDCNPDINVVKLKSGEYYVFNSVNRKNTLEIYEFIKQRVYQ